MKWIHVNPEGHIPLYQQIINSVEKAIGENELRQNDRLPSLNKVCLAHGMSRDTVLQAYEILKERGIIQAIPGKGYYVKTEQVQVREKIFLLFDELNAFKETLYNAFSEHIDPSSQADIFFHHFNRLQFSKLIADSRGRYTRYIIMPTHLPGVAKQIRTLPKEKVIILDQTNPSLSSYPGIYQHFEEDMRMGLETALPRLKRYQKMVLVFPGQKEPLGMVTGFTQFCKSHKIPYTVQPDFNKQVIQPGTVWVVVQDHHLVAVLEQGRKQKLRLGQDYGIISYNDIPLKRVVGKGISTISTDFARMGASLAEMINQNRMQQIKNPASLILRNSL